MVRNPVHARATGSEGKAVPDTAERGASLKRAIHVARAEAAIPSDRRLAINAGVDYKTLFEWYAGGQPSPGTLAQVAEALGIPVSRLWAAWELQPAPVPDATLADLVSSISELVGELRQSRLVQDEVLRAFREAIPDARSQGLQGPEVGPSSELPASAPPAGRKARA